MAPSTTPPRWLPLVVFTSVGLLILGPLLLPGYILTFDMVFAPHQILPLQLDNLLPFNALMNLFNMVMPEQILQKLLLLAVFMLSGLGVYRLIAVPDPWPRYMAGLLYAINPFTYARFMDGQYLVLAGYALLPWLLAALRALVERPSWRRAMVCTAWLCATSAVSIHYFGFALLALAIMCGLTIVTQRWRATLLVAGVMGAGLVVNAFWLVPLASGHGSASQIIQNAGEAQLLTFRSDPDPTFGLPLNLLALYGTWTDREGLYTLPKTIDPAWWVVATGLIGLAAVGLVIAWRHRRRVEVGLVLALATVGFGLALGIMDSPLAPLNQWLFDHLAILRGYREPGKGIGLIALAEAYGAGWGAAWILARLRRPLAKQLVPGLLLALPILAAPTMVWGAADQLSAVSYPADWYAVKRTLAASPDDSRVLFLPWHQYLAFTFTNDRLVANPAQRFFGPRIIQGDNAEIGLIPSGAPNPAASSDALAAYVRQHHIGYIILAQTADASSYTWLAQQPRLKLVNHTATLQLYHVVDSPGGQP